MFIFKCITIYLHRQQIMAVLNAQTTVQFQQYAKEQYPDNPDQQQLLIRQLQEQHYQQYMHQALHLQQVRVWPETLDSSITILKGVVNILTIRDLCTFKTSCKCHRLKHPPWYKKNDLFTYFEICNITLANAFVYLMPLATHQHRHASWHSVT